MITRLRANLRQGQNLNHKWSGIEIRISELIRIEIRINPDFRINSDSKPVVRRIAPKMLWIYYLSASVISLSVVKIGRWLYEKC